MGIALTTFSALSRPVRTLTRWLHSAHQVPAARGANADSELLNEPSSLPSTGAPPTAPRPVPQPGLGISRPVRGNWPFTVSLPPSPVERDKKANRKGANAGPALPSARNGHSTGRTWSKGGCGPTKNGQGVISQRAPGRIVIAGRMADVCAELDRMVACEARLQAH
jgi:hypothetical protein